jgi:molecular chaperone GrpE
LRAVPQERVTNVPTDEAAKEVHKDLVSLHQGLQLIETVLLNTLKRHGVERFDPSEEADVFDPNKHEAVFMAPQPDKKDNTVFHTSQKGFLLNGRVIRVSRL